MGDHITELNIFLGGFLGGIAAAFFAFVLVVWILGTLENRGRR